MSSSYLATIKLQRVIQEFRSLDPEMQMQTALAFLYIAERDLNNNKTTVGDVGTYLELSSASASRNVAVLSRQAKSKWGYELILVEPNPERRNEKFLTLTAKGTALIKRLEGYINVSSDKRK
jgi:DNA-binding MarR family transcriptional regulator